MSIDVNIFWSIGCFVLVYLVVMFSIKKIIEWFKRK